MGPAEERTAAVKGKETEAVQGKGSEEGKLAETLGEEKHGETAGGKERIPAEAPPMEIPEERSSPTVDISTGCVFF